MTNEKYTPRVIGQGIAGAAFVAANILLSPLTQRWYHKWGASDDELQRSLPGDELLPQAKSEITGAITVQAPAAQVWPWLAQIGCQRAGWYSYDLLDNGGIPSAERIIPEHQQIEIGDEVWLTPDGKARFPVAAVEPGKALVLSGLMDTKTGQEIAPHDPRPEAYFGGTQVYLLQELDAKSTRLLFRLRFAWSHSLSNTLIYRGFMEPISFVMGRKTLLGIKQRAEAT